MLQVQPKKKGTGHGLQCRRWREKKKGWVGETTGDGDEEGKEREEEKRKIRFLRPHSLPSGPTCSEEVTACHSGPCLNGGSCSPSPGGYSCACPLSHTGLRCQTSIDHCASGEFPPRPGAGPEGCRRGPGYIDKKLTGHREPLFGRGSWQGRGAVPCV